MVVNNIDARFKASIDNYGKKIDTLKDFVTAVRTLPGMYVGSIGNRGFLNMIREVYQNSIDQAKSNKSPCDHIWVYYNEKTLEVTVEDNGLGLPFEKMVQILTFHHTSSNYNKEKFEYSSGRHGSGLKAVNGLSCKLSAISYRYDGTAMKLDTVNGYPTKDPYKVPNKECKQGTKITFFPETKVMGELSLDWKTVYHMIKRIVSLTPIGTAVTLVVDDIKGIKHVEEIVNKDGIITELIDRVKKPVIKPISFMQDTGEMRVEVAFCFDSEEGEAFDPITSFCNMTPTEDGGTHVAGVMEGITRWFLLYMNNVYLNNNAQAPKGKSKNKIKVTAADIRSNIHVVVSAAHLYPIFGGQAKDSVTNEDLQPFCKDVVMKGLDEWSKANPQDLAKISRFFKDLAEIRQKGEESKAKVATKYQSNTLTGLPAKFYKPSGKEHLELLIVEGDSAGGSAKTARDTKRQGVFPIRGKIINAFQNSKHKVMANEEVQGIIAILFDGAEYKKGFDPIKDCKWEKIIFMADADVDGKHISTLLLRLFLMYFPQLITAGKVFKAVPPLYSVRQNKKIQYFTEQLDITRYVQKNFTQKYQISHVKNKKHLTSKELTLLFMKNTDLVYYLERVGTTYAVNFELLEMILVNHITKGTAAALKKKVKAKYRFMDVSTVKGVTCVSGTIDKSNKVYITDQTITGCAEAIAVLKENTEFSYLVNGQEMTIYQIMKLYDSCSPTGLQRYKGLGEMDSEELWESTLDPDGNRTLVQYTMDDVKEELEIIRDYESDLSKLLDLVGTINRADLED